MVGSVGNHKFCKEKEKEAKCGSDFSLDCELTNQHLARRQDFLLRFYNHLDKVVSRWSEEKVKVGKFSQSLTSSLHFPARDNKIGQYRPDCIVPFIIMRELFALALGYWLEGS